jgi:hypothetical protein
MVGETEEPLRSFVRGQRLQATASSIDVLGHRAPLEILKAPSDCQFSRQLFRLLFVDR